MVKRNTKNWFRHGSWWRRLRNNRKYRDVLFRQLFRDKKDLLDLYNALNGSTYQNPEELEVVTMEDVIFMKIKNDLSFMIGNTLNLRVELPTPVYIVFYNGSRMQTDNLVLYLSDSFSGGRGSGCLECTCEVLNINRGYNQALMEKCHRLWEYSEFSAEIEENIKRGMRREEAIHTAIDTCIEKGILRDILIKQRAEVLHMLLTEYDEKKHFRTLFREGKEEGIKEGLEKGRLEGIEIGLSKGREEKLRELVEKKRSRGKTVTEIAEELEEAPLVIEQIIDGLNG